MNTGLLSTLPKPPQFFKPQWLIPTAGAVQPTFGADIGFGIGTNCWYGVSNGWCYGHWSVIWGSGGTAGSGGTGYVMELPVPAMPFNDYSKALADYSIGQVYLSGGGMTTIGQTFISLGNTTNGEIGKWAGFIFPSSEKSGTATVANASNSVTVTHGFATTPSYVDVLPSGSWQAATCLQFWPDTVGATTFKLNATGAAAGNLTANLAFRWVARVDAWAVGPGSAVALGSVLDHLEGVFCYPVATGYVA